MTVPAPRENSETSRDTSRDLIVVVLSAGEFTTTLSVSHLTPVREAVRVRLCCQRHEP